MSFSKIIFFGFLLILGSIHCGGSGKAGAGLLSEGIPLIFQGNKTFPSINEDKSAGLKGVDANNNGIRDDIDELIAQKFSKTPAIKRAAEQDARATQQLMEAETKDQAFAAAEQTGRAIHCQYSLPDLKGRENEHFRDSLSREIEALTANTRERLKKYLHSNKLVGGGYFTQSKEPACD